jgi:hypothetical protein
MTQLTQRSSLETARVLLNPDISESDKAAVSEVLGTSTGDSPVLRSIKTGQAVTISNAFLGAVQGKNLFEGIEPNSQPRTIRMRANYLDDDHFVIDTRNGPIPVEAILFIGTLSVAETLVPISTTSEYRELETGEMLSQVAAFEPHEVQGMRLSLELHRLGETGETHVIIRKVDGDA